MKHLLIFLSILLLFSCKKELPTDQDLEDGTIDPNRLPALVRTTINSDSVLIQLPYKYSAQNKYSLLVGFAAFGGRAGEGSLEDLSGVAGKIRRNLTLDQNLVIVCPQNNSGLFTPGEVNNFINSAIATYSIDTTRLYLTGLIKGAYNVLNYLSDKPEYAKRIAAAVPMTSLQLDQYHFDHLYYAQQTKVLFHCATQDEFFEENKMYAEKMMAEFIPFNHDQISYWKLYSPLTIWNDPTIYQRMLQYKK